MALFASACEDELRHASGAAALAAGSPLCARVQDGCTGGDADGDAGVGGDDDETEAYYVQFPILLEMDKCAAVLAVEGGGAFLQSYLANCSDAPLCVGELETARALLVGIDQLFHPPRQLQDLLSYRDDSRPRKDGELRDAGRLRDGL